MKKGEIKPPQSACSSLPGVPLHFEQSTVPLLLGSSNTAELEGVHKLCMQTHKKPWVYFFLFSPNYCKNAALPFHNIFIKLESHLGSRNGRNGKRMTRKCWCVWEEGCLLLVYLFWGEIKCFVWRLFAREAEMLSGPCKRTAKFVSRGERNLGRMP